MVLCWTPRKSVRLLALAYSRGALAGIAAETKRLKVADGIRAALVFGDDGGHFQGTLVPCWPINSLRPSTRSGPGPLVSFRAFAEPLIGLRWRERCA